MLREVTDFFSWDNNADSDEMQKNSCISSESKNSVNLQGSPTFFKRKFFNIPFEFKELIKGLSNFRSNTLHVKSTMDLFWINKIQEKKICMLKGQLFYHIH